MALRGESLAFTDVEIDALSEVAYGDARTFALLSLILPGFDLTRHFHVDHIYPQRRFTDAQLRKAGVYEALPHNLLPNLQLLEGSINNQKRRRIPHEWYALDKPDARARKEYLAGLEIADLPEEIKRFPEFYEHRNMACASGL
ncbi:hypothetical protein [Ensifer sp. NM-2]|uniref:hypothetical protein n=1 Tax=Ensifer sp. NM-2 TaxID=2109730 RepID=UPI001FE02248|nr:hypothetical protein [Ensifer sp. NM-2]